MSFRIFLCSGGKSFEFRFGHLAQRKFSGGFAFMRILPKWL